MRVSVVIPFRWADDPHRERAFDYVMKYFLTHFDEHELIVGNCPTQEWSKGGAVNEGVARASGDVLILNDADSIIRPEGIREALKAIEGGRQWIVPHDYVLRLTEAATEKVYAAESMDKWPRNLSSLLVRHAYMGPPGGGINIMTRKAFDTVNGMDPRFTGWGGEDISFAKALTTMGVWHWRLTGHPLWHLYHPHPAPDLRGTPEAEAMVARYNQADRKPELMRELLFSR